jgi:hypothetical protein
MQISIQTSSLAPTDHKHPPDLELCVGNDFGERLVDCFIGAGQPRAALLNCNV